jgi:hypothetical protein
LRFRYPNNKNFFSSFHLVHFQRISLSQLGSPGTLAEVLNSHILIPSTAAAFINLLLFFLITQPLEAETLRGEFHWNSYHCSIFVRVFGGKQFLERCIMDYVLILPMGEFELSAFQAINAVKDLK